MEDALEFPGWFTAARESSAAQCKTVECEGARIAYQTWGDPASRPVLLLHGAGASSEWWEATAILLASDYYLIAPSFAGCGRSQWRESYDIEQSVVEALACTQAENLHGPEARPICIAHSFGSETGARLAIEPAQPISQLILIDSLLGLYGSFEESLPARERQTYPTEDDAAGRYSTMPRDDFGPPFLRDHVARQSLEQVTTDSGDTLWTWRADPNLMINLKFEPILSSLGEARCPTDFLYGEKSSMNSPELRARQAHFARPDSKFVEIKEVGHHILLDRPRELANVIRKTIAQRD